MWTLPGPGTEPVSPALTGGFLSTAPPEKSCSSLKKSTNQSINLGTFLVVQWLRLCSPNEGGPGSIPGLGTRSHVPQLRPHVPK